jgi:hypothetical protein
MMDRGMRAAGVPSLGVSWLRAANKSAKANNSLDDLGGDDAVA